MKEGLPRAAAVAALAASDPALAPLRSTVGPCGLEVKRTPSVFAALAEAIVYQQLHGKAAATIFGRLRGLFPRKRLDPLALLALGDEDLRGAGLSRAKLAALRDLAARTSAGELPALAALRRLDDEAVVALVSEVRGIGRWTAERLLIFRLGRPDVLPATDYGVRKGFGRVFGAGPGGELPPPSAVVERGERWRPHRSVATWYLWRAAELEAGALAPGGRRGRARVEGTR